MTKASLQALFVTLLWSTSWVLIKLSLSAIPPLTFAGLRYFLAFLFLLPFLFRKQVRSDFSHLSRSDWTWLLLLGVVYYTLTQGSQFLALVYLPANMLSLLLTLSGISIALFARIFLEEKLSRLQWLGVFVSIFGALIYFGNIELTSMLGLIVGVFAIVSNSAGALLGRKVNREARLSPALVTLISMGAGATILLLIGLVTEDFPQLAARDWGIIVWLAAVNTSFAFTLWNLSLQKLSAAQSSVINNTMLIQIAILAWIFLGERLNAIQISGLIIAAVGTVLVQLRRKTPQSLS